MFPLTRDRSRNRSAIGFRPSLILNFGQDSNDILDPRITFSRASNATLVNSAGAVAYAPHNLLTFSESFDNSAWTKSRATVSANTTTAPDGTTTADKLVEDTTASNTHQAFQSQTVTSGLTYTLSIYAKAAERGQVALNISSGAGAFSAASQVIVDLSNGSIVSGSGAVVALDNGWYRISASNTAIATAAADFIVRIAVAGNTSYTGNGTSGLFIWGAQLNVGALQPYYPTTVKNALGFTQEFNNAAWTKSNSSITANATTAPDGSLTADKLVEDTATSGHNIVATVTAPDNAVMTASAYVKPDGRSWVAVAVADKAGGNNRVWFNVSTGVQGTTNGTVTAFSATNVGNGWYRIGVTASVATGGGTPGLRISIGSADNTASYTGDGTSGIFIWGAQLSDSASLDPYVYNPVAAFTSTAYYGPRFDYDPVTLAPRGLLIEEQRTNLVLQSGFAGATTGTPGAAPTSWTLGFGTGTETTLVNSIYGSIDGAQAVRFNADATERVMFQQLINVTSGVQYAFSVELEAVSGSVGDLMTITAGTTTATQNTFATNPSTVGRKIILFTANGTGTVNLRVGIGTTAGVSGTCSATVSRAQVEAGSFSTSYIPTTTAAATRAADVATMVGDNFSNWFNATEGTLFAEASNAQGSPALFSTDDGTTSNRIITSFNIPNSVALRVVSGGVDQANFSAGTITQNAAFKFSGAYKVNDFAASLNGAAAVTDTSGTVPTGQIAARIGSNVAAGVVLNGYIRRIGFFPRRLANAELQALTS